jgi:hypothetical protein
MGTGSYFGDIKNPKVMVQVGQPGDSGVLEIVDMLFTVKGATAGAILMAWNVHESTQGSGNTPHRSEPGPVVRWRLKLTNTCT